MAVPNIDSIVASMRDCSLNSGRGAEPPHQPVAAVAQEQEVTVELNSDTAFPNHSKQFLDTKTGKKFHVIEDEEGNDGDVEDCSSVASGGTDYEDFFGLNSRNSYSSSSDDSDAGGENGGEGDLILVVVGCKSCFMYFMVPKRVEACPKCGGCLLHFG